MAVNVLIKLMRQYKYENYRPVQNCILDSEVGQRVSNVHCTVRT